MIAIQKCLLKDRTTAFFEFESKEDLINHLNNLPSIDNSELVYVFGSVETIRYFELHSFFNNRLISSLSFSDISILFFLSYIQNEFINFDGYFKQVSQLNEKDIGKFCMSNSSFKQWSGQVIKDRYDLNFMKQNLQCDTLLYLSERKELDGLEYRCWCKGEQVVECTEYEGWEQRNKQSVLEREEVIDYVERLNRNWIPSDYFLLDVCKFQGKLRVMEYNCCVSSGFYNADIEKIMGIIE